MIKSCEGVRKYDTALQFVELLSVMTAITLNPISSKPGGS